MQNRFVYFGSFWFILVGFYSTTIIVSYFMPNPFYTYKQFYFKQFSLAQIHSLILFDPF